LAETRRILAAARMARIAGCSRPVKKLEVLAAFDADRGLIILYDPRVG